MFVTKLHIAGLRSIEQAEFTFQPGMNLLVGVNGVGKTTVLDALRVCLSRILPEITASRSNKIDFADSDIKIGAKSIQLDCKFIIESISYDLLIKKESQEYPTIFTQKNIVTEDEEGYSRSGENLRTDEEKRREAVVKIADIEFVTPPLSLVAPKAKTSQQQILGVYLSTRRSLMVDQEPTKTSIAGGQAAAFADSLSPNRELNLRLVAEWFDAQKELGDENLIRLKHIENLRDVVNKFLPSFKNLDTIRIENVTTKTKKNKIVFRVEKDGIQFQLDQLSDGERGVLAIVMELARRLSQANPELDNPVKDGVAIVLIDELDLHLHPKWQRTVVDNLTRTFQNCQFIATTHSPQIIPAVEPERVQLLKDGEVIHPDRTLGMDSNWILRNLMEADDRPEESAAAIKHAEALIKEGDYEEARNAMMNYRQDGFDLPEWAMLEARISRFELLDEE